MVCNVVCVKCFNWLLSINSYSAFLLMVAMHFFEVLNSYDFFKKELKLLCKPAGERVKMVRREVFLPLSMAVTLRKSNHRLSYRAIVAFKRSPLSMVANLYRFVIHRV